MKSTALARCRFQLREGIRFDLGLLLVLVPLALWMGILDTWITPCAVLFMLASAGLKLLASRAPSMDRSQQFGYGAYLLNVASQLCVGRAFGPLFFTPVMLSFFTLGACVSHTGRYRAAIVTTGALALLGAVLVEVLGVIPPSYAFTDVDALRMTIVAHAVRLPEVPTITALTVAGLAMILGTGFMIARVLGVLQEADRRSALWAWQLKHLLPDEAHAPMSPPRR